MLTNKDISEITKKIAENINPEKIYLFGSYANGKPNEDSDLDIAVIDDRAGNKDEDISYKINFVQRVNNPIDIDVYKNAEFDQKVKNNFTFENTITNEGVLIYG